MVNVQNAQDVKICKSCSRQSARILIIYYIFVSFYVKSLFCRAGEVFVHSNMGNLVPGNDLNAMSVLEFAVDHLEVTDIIVVGHYGCDACSSAVGRQELGKSITQLTHKIYMYLRIY